MAISISIHDVNKIELLRSFPSNSNSRTIRITGSNDLLGISEVFEITVYGDTEAFDALPKADDYIFHGPEPVVLETPEAA